MRINEILNESWPTFFRALDMLRKAKKFKHLPDEKLEKMAHEVAKKWDSGVKTAPKKTQHKVQDLTKQYKQDKQQMGDEEFFNYYGFSRPKTKVTEKWSKKYKDSINCSNPKGFSQRAHCDGKKKTNEDVDLTQGRNLNPETTEYVNNHKWKLTTVNPQDLDTDAYDDPYNRVIDVDPDYAVDFDFPIIVDADGIIIDGFHRVYQAQQQGLEEIPAYIPVGSVSEGMQILQQLEETIRKNGSKWTIYSKRGRKLGSYDTKKSAKKRLKQIEYFKHMKEDYDADLPVVMSLIIEALDNDSNWNLDGNVNWDYVASDVWIAFEYKEMGYDDEEFNDLYMDAAERVAERFGTNPPYHGGLAMENFADGKKPGRKGLAKRMGVDCSKSVTALRKIAKNSSGEKQRMAHWCANMKSGRKKK